MPELIHVPGALGIENISNNLGTAVMEAMVHDGQLPVDFQVRLLTITDTEERVAVGTQDVLAALGYGLGSGRTYLTDELPDCILFTPYSPPLRPILSSVDVDYHILRDMRSVAEDIGLPSHLARSAWAQYVHHLDPELYATLSDVSDPRGPDAEKERRSFFRMRLGLTAIRDDALCDVYDNLGALKGHGESRKRILHHLLLDNHPEFGAEPIY